MIDALLFVFGYRARKIRSKKLSVLIHNSEKHRDIESCTVSIHFQRIIDLVCTLYILLMHNCVTVDGITYQNVGCTHTTGLAYFLFLHIIWLDLLSFTS